MMSFISSLTSSLLVLNIILLKNTVFFLESNPNIFCKWYSLDLLKLNVILLSSL